MTVRLAACKDVPIRSNDLGCLRAHLSSFSVYVMTVGLQSVFMAAKAACCVLGASSNFGRMCVLCSEQDIV